MQAQTNHASPRGPGKTLQAGHGKGLPVLTHGRHEAPTLQPHTACGFTEPVTFSPA